MGKLRVVLADDHQMMLEGLRLLINSQDDMEVVGEAENGQAAVVLAQKLQPDVVVMDISMPEMNGLKATQSLQRTCPNIKILTLTRHTDDGYLQQLLQSGSSGYVLKQSASEELIRAIRLDCGRSHVSRPGSHRRSRRQYFRRASASRLFSRKKLKRPRGRSPAAGCVGFFEQRNCRPAAN